MKQIISSSEFRQLRKSRGVSQAKIARDLNLQRSYISQFENGRYLFNDLDQSRLSEYFATLPIINEIESDNGREEVLSVQACDGFLFPEGVDPLIIEQGMQTINHELSEIQSLLCQKAPTSFLWGGVDSDAMDRIGVAIGLKSFSILNQLWSLRGDALLSLSSDDDSVAAVFLAGVNDSKLD